MNSSKMPVDGRYDDIRFDYIYKLRFEMPNGVIREVQVSNNIFNMSNSRMKEIYDMCTHMWKLTFMAHLPDKPLYEEQVF